MHQLLYTVNIEGQHVEQVKEVVALKGFNKAHGRH